MLEGYCSKVAAAAVAAVASMHRKDATVGADAGTLATGVMSCTAAACATVGWLRSVLGGGQSRLTPEGWLAQAVSWLVSLVVV